MTGNIRSPLSAAGLAALHRIRPSTRSSAAPAQAAARDSAPGFPGGGAGAPPRPNGCPARRPRRSVAVHLAEPRPSSPSGILVPARPAGLDSASSGSRTSSTVAPFQAPRTATRPRCRPPDSGQRRPPPQGVPSRARRVGRRRAPGGRSPPASRPGAIRARRRVHPLGHLALPGGLEAQHPARGRIVDQLEVDLLRLRPVVGPIVRHGPDGADRDPVRARPASKCSRPPRRSSRRP